jgi:hypothetical protein
MTFLRSAVFAILAPTAMFFLSWTQFMQRSPAYRFADRLSVDQLWMG